jgi:hypothetical protein
MNRMEAMKRWGGSNGRKRRVEAKGTPFRERKGRAERKGKNNERDEKELKQKEGNNEWQGRVATKGRPQ